MYAGNEAIRPAYAVEPVKGKVRRAKMVYDDKKKQFVRKEIVEEAGFIVYLPNGHSVRIRSQAELARLKLDGEPNIVDMSSGDVVATIKRRGDRVAGAVELDLVEEKI